VLPCSIVCMILCLAGEGGRFPHLPQWPVATHEICTRRTTYKSRSLEESYTSCVHFTRSTKIFIMDLSDLVQKLTLFVTAGWQRRSGTPNTPVTASAADDDGPGCSVDDRADPDPCRLNGFTLSFHVAACDPALAVASLSRDV